MMNQTPEMEPARPRWAARHKRLLIVGTGFLLLALAVLAGFFYVRSGRLNRYIADQVKTAVKEYGLRAEIGGFSISWGVRTAKLRDVKLYNDQTGQLIATVDRAEMVTDVPAPLALRLRREIIFKRLDVQNLNLYLDVDEQGRSNLRGLHNAPPSAPSRITFDFSGLLSVLDGGTVHINDRQHRIEGEVGGLRANAQTAPNSMVNANFSTGAGRFKYQGRDFTLDSLELAGRGGPNGAEVDRFALRARAAEADVNGRIDDWNALRYNFGVQTRVTLGEVAKVVDQVAGLQGTAAFNGRVEGEKERYHVTGEVTSDELADAGTRIRGAKVTGVNVSSDGEAIHFESSQARVQSISTSGARLNDVATGAIRGEYRDGATRATVPQISVGRVDVAQGRVVGITLQNVSATSSDTGRYKVNASLGVRSGTVSGASFGPVNGALVADNDTVSLNQFKAALFGGSATGDAVVQLGRGGASQLKATFNGLKTGDVLAVAAVTSAPLAGTVDGTANISWPGTNVLAMSGAITAHLTAATTQTADAIPVTGDVNVQARNGAFDVNQLNLATDASRLTATGRLSQQGDSDLRFSLTSTQAEQLQTIATANEEIKKAIASVEPQISGDITVEGRVTGKLTDPMLDANLNLASISLFDEPLGSVSGHLLFSPAEVRFDNGLLTAANGGTAKFDYAAPRAAPNGLNATDGRLDATVDRISVDTLIAAAGLPNRQQFISGEISGEAHLTGLPGSPTGRATFNLVNGTLAGQPADLATANLVFDGQTTRLERTEVRTAQGHLVAQGTLDLKSYDFQAQVNVDNLSLGELASAFEVASPTVSGTVNATLNATGNAKDIEQLKVDLTAQGQNVTINGRPAGELSLTARTSASGRIDLDLTTGIAGKPQPLRASIELRKPGRPVEIQTDLTDFDLAPVIAAFAPDLASSVAATVNGRLRVAGPIVNEKGEATLEGLRGNLTLDTVALQLSGSPITVQTPLVVSLSGPQLTLERTSVSGEGIDLSLGGTLGLNEEARVNFSATGTANLETLSRLSPDMFFAGSVTIDARMEGAARDPRLAGEIRVNGFSFSMLDPSVTVEDGQGRFVLAGDRITLENFTARVNDGDLTASGTFTLDQLQPKEWRFVAKANDVIVFYQGAQATVNGDLTLAGTPAGQLLSGTITIPQAEYATDFNFDSLTATGNGGGLSFGGGGEVGVSSRLAPVSLNVHVEADDSLLIRNEQVNTVGSASLTVAGTLNDPSITGRVTLEGGTIKFRSQRYEITTGTLDFPAGGGTDPEVNILTEGDVSGYHVYVGLTGPLSDLDVTLRSDPDLPRADILSLVTTGRTESDTLGGQDLVRSGVGTAASLLTQEFISKPTESLLGLNRFQIDPLLRPNSNPAARLTIGRQIARNLSFTYSTNLASDQDQTALAEYTLSNRFSGIASYTQGGNSARGGSTDSDFTIEVRGRKRFSLGYVPSDLMAGTNTNRAAAPPRPSRPPLPHAEVTVDKPQGVRLSDKRIRELLPVAAQGFSRPLARLGERNLTNYLQEHGYFFANVTSRCEPADCSGPNLRVLYDVQPGQRLDLEEVRLEGTNEIGLGDVSGDLQTQRASFVGGIPFLKNLPLIGGYARGITSNDRLAHDREVIRRRLADLGYRGARVEARLAFKPESDNLTIVFAVEEGPRSTVSEIAVAGNLVVPSKELRDVVPVEEEQAFSLTAARNGAQGIKKLYADRGYLEATAELSVVDLPDNRVRLVYNVNEGSRNVASEIVITGQTKTHEDSIRRFVAFDLGDTLTPALIRSTQRELYATGAFREVNIRTEPLPGGDEHARRVTVGVTEARPLLFVYGLGFSTDDGARASVQLTNSNFLGRANSASIRLRGSRSEQLVQFQSTDLRPWGTRWATTVSTFYNRNTNLQNFARRKLVGGGFEDVGGRSFGINRFAAFIQTERKLSETTSIRFRYNFENARLSNAQNIPIEEIARNQQSIRLGMLAAGFTRDTRDSAINATTGQLFSAEHSVAARFLGGNEAFNKFFGNYQAYKTLPQTTPVLHDSVLAFAARVGLASRFGAVSPQATPATQDLLPISERFFAGGATTLRGFHFEAAGPQGILEPRNAQELPTLVPVGGNALTVFNFELRYPLTRRLRLVPFYDFGNVFRRVSDINFGGMTNSVGLGLRFNTPIGPVGVDYGYLLDPPSFVTASGGVLRQPRGVIHIRFGQTF